MAVLDTVNARLREAGITVHEYPNWRTRDNGYALNPVGGIVHHTATGYGMALPTTDSGQMLANGHSTLAGPLCNYGGNMDGSLTVIADGAANHAGASGGSSMGPLPVTKLFNPKVVGLEIVYPGTSPMTPEQYRTAKVWARIIADVFGGGNVESVRAHAETSVTGKWDPGYANDKTIDMNLFRREAATILEDDVLPDERNATLSTHAAIFYAGGVQGDQSIIERLVELQQTTRYLKTEVDALKARLDQVQAGNVDYAALATAVADESAKRMSA